MSQIRRSYGNIHGIIHAAGVIADKNIHEKTEEQFDRVFNTKVFGFKNLLNATNKDQIKQITVFSSIAARTGNTGQVDYAMANEVLNRMCHAEQKTRGKECRVKSIGWGPWEGGMVSPELATVFKKKGIPLIPIEEGATYFVEEIQGTRTGCELVFGGSLGQVTNTQREHGTPKTWKLWIHELSHPYLKSHAIQGIPVMPVVCIANICMELAKTIYPETCLSINGLVVQHGIRCNGFNTTGDWLTISCATASKNNDLIFSVTNAEDLPCYRMAATAEGTSSPPPVLSPPTNSVPWQIPPNLIYQEHLFHGEDFQVIQSLTSISETTCEAQLKMNGTSNGLPAHMAILDGGLQLALLWEHNRSEKASLPTAIKSLRIFDYCLKDQEIRCILQNTRENQLSTQWNVHFIDANGHLVAEIEGLEIHVLLNGQTKSTPTPMAVSVK